MGPEVDRLVGRRGTPFRMVVESGKIREFARALGARDPEYFAESRAITPATFLISAAHWMTPENSAWGGERPDLSRVLHGEQRFTFVGAPPCAGTTLIGEQWIDRVYEKRGRRGGRMQFFEIVTRFCAESGEEVATMRSTTIVTDRAAAQ